MGVVAGDALGVPYGFHTREKIRSNPATTMRGYGTYELKDQELEKWYYIEFIGRHGFVCGKYVKRV